MDTPALIILGSAAAEGLPAFFCKCPACTNARKVGGKEIRKRCSYNLGGRLQVDYGPDIMQAFQKYEEVNQTRHVIFTHAHDDHLACSELYYKAQGFSQSPPSDPLVLHGTDAVYRRLAGYRRGVLEADTDAAILAGFGIVFREIRPFEPFDIPEIGAHIIPLRANHDQKVNPVIYSVTLGGRTVLFGNDTASLPDDTREYLAAAAPVALDIAILDDCYCMRPSGSTHMGADDVLRTFGFLASAGYVTDKTVKVVNHFSHNPGMSHVQLEEYWLPKGVLVGHDDMVL